MLKYKTSKVVRSGDKSSVGADGRPIENEYINGSRSRTEVA